MAHLFSGICFGFAQQKKLPTSIRAKWWGRVIIAAVVFFGAFFASHRIHGMPRWWFQIFFIFTPTWGNDPM